MSQGYVGEVRPFGGNFAPAGWQFCDGSLLSIANYPVLYQLIGTTYGGNGTTDFAVPDLRGRAIIHQGTGSGLAPYVMGEHIGLENATVSVQQMASHPHTFSGTNAGGNAANPGPTVVLAATPIGEIYDGTAAPVALSPQAVSLAGGSQPHNNRQPYLAISYIIALEGLYPSQS
jgi:microcystin-dependent protein